MSFIKFICIWLYNSRYNEIVKKEGDNVENLKFIRRVAVVHIVTYIVCGMIFSAIFDYNTLFTTGNVAYFMKPVEGVSVIIGPLLQIVRGVLFGITLLFMKDVFIGKKFGWLKLWFIIFVLGIINTPGPAPFSIEGFIYTQLPLEFHLKGAPELLVQTMLFSYIVANPNVEKLSGKFKQNQKYVTPPILAGIMFSLSGIALALILNVDVTAGTTDIGAFVVMFISITIVYFINRWYYFTNNKFKIIMTFIVYYVALAVLPTVYNLITNSPFQSFLTLGINSVPVIILIGYNIYTTNVEDNY